MKYTMYKFSTNSTRVFENKDELIAYFSSHVTKSWWSKRKECSLFEEINVTGKDVTILHKQKVKYDGEGNYVNTTYYTEKYLKDIMVFDEYNRTIDIRMFKDEILNQKYNKDNLPKIKTKNMGYNHPYEFRKTPVPYTKKRHFHYERDVKYKHKLMKYDFNGYDINVNRDKKKKNELFDILYWREFPTKDFQKSWKKQSKKRKQWM